MNDLLQKKERRLLASAFKTQPNFKYDKSGVKARLMMSVKGAPQGEEEVSIAWISMPNWGVVLTALVIMLGTATFAYADNAKPGDVLFPVNKLNDKIILNLPFSAQTKARIQAQIVSKRLDALDTISKDDRLGKQDPTFMSKKLLTVKESHESLSTAIKKVSENQKRLEENGNEHGAEQLKETLTRLENLAAMHEAKIQYLEEHTQDRMAKDEIHQHLDEIKQERKKIKDQLKIKGIQLELEVE